MSKINDWKYIQNLKMKYGFAVKRNNASDIEFYKELLTKNYLRYMDDGGQKRDNEINEICSRF